MTGFGRHLYVPAAFVVGVVVTLSVDHLWSTIRHRFRPAEVESKTPDGRSTATIVDGIEGCIGNTPLIKIRSLSDATGCEILAKAEVRTGSEVRTPTSLIIRSFPSFSMELEEVPRTESRSASSRRYHAPVATSISAR